MKVFLIGLFLLVTSSQALLFGPDDPNQAVGDKPLPSQNFSYYVQLDENYELYWDFNDTHIIFETHVMTNGYIGFGISPNGGMQGSDVVIGWVKDGQTHFSDRHADGEFMPIEDTQQDWTLLGAAENGNYTSLKMVRKLETCDPQDLPILKGTTRVIFSYHPDDPASHNNIGYHGPDRRGVRSLLLLDPPVTEQSDASTYSNLMTIDFLNKNFSVPSRDTTYHCILSKMPDLDQKYHMIRYEPIIQPGHEKLLHHILLYYCTGDLDDKWLGYEWDCDQENPHYGADCDNAIVAWAVGGSAYNYPLNVGHSFGTARDPKYFRLETHYDNPGLRSDFVDNSGFRIFLTTDLREHDAGIIEAGIGVNNDQIIPPYYSEFLSVGYCSEACISKGLGDQEVKVFASILHAHLLGVKLRARHFRNGVELEPLQEDNTYDFNYQEIRAMSEERVLKKGDSIVVECIYDSRSRSSVTYGGLSTRHEMCLAFLWYYPRAALTNCLSSPVYPAQYAGIDVESLDWTDPSIRDQFVKILQDSDIGDICHGDVPGMEWSWQVVPQPNITRDYQRPSMCPSK